MRKVILHFELKKTKCLGKFENVVFIIIILETGINVFKSNYQIMKNKKYYKISTIRMHRKIIYDPSLILQLSEFVWTLRSSLFVVFNNFLLIDTTDRSKISSDQKRLFFAVSL